MIERARRELARVRESTGARAELAYAATTDAEGYDTDANAGRRALVLWALQYDHGPSDLPLVRWLVEQESVCRREAAFQGLTAEAELAGFLLASYRDASDVWRQWDLKRANFDTWCGYDEQYLVAAGVGPTLEHVRASDHPQRADLLERLASLDATDLDGWRRRKGEWFPADPAAEEPLTWVERAALLGERDEAEELLRRWAAEEARDPAVLSAWFAELGVFAEAADAQRAVVAEAGTQRARASGGVRLAGYERRAGRLDQAWEALRACGAALAGEPGWQEVGLGRSYVEELFLLARAASGEPARAAFAEADRLAAEVPGLPLVVLAAAVDAAENAGEVERVAAYRDLHRAEHDRIHTDD